MKMQHITFYGKYLLINYSSTLTSAQLLVKLLYTIIDTLACFFLKFLGCAKEKWKDLIYVRKSFKYVSFEVFSNESVHLLTLSHCEMVLPAANNTCNISCKHTGIFHISCIEPACTNTCLTCNCGNTLKPSC